MSSLVVGNARLVPVTVPGSPTSPAPDGPVDIVVTYGQVSDVLPAGSVTPTVDAGGRPVIPGLWDKHVHMTQWARTTARVDVSDSAGPQDVVRIIGDHIASLGTSVPHDSVVVGWGHRSAGWDEPATVAALDAVSGGHPIVIISGDGHNGWLNSAALRAVDLPPHEYALDEAEWFAVFGRAADLAAADEDLNTLYDSAIAEAHRLGVVGIVDMEFDAAAGTWPRRLAAGVRPVRVRTNVYADGLEAVIAEGRRTGDAAPGTDGLVQMAGLKIISDGSLGTRTAYCCDPYPPALADPKNPRGKLNNSVEHLQELLERATQNGLRIALHAIGDAAVSQALDAFERTGAQGAVEHAQLMCRNDIQRMAHLGIVASVQPAHLLDDRDLTTRCWPGREDRSFALRSMIDAGVTLAMGSDAPVARLDPWLAMAAAVHRTADEREAWVPQEAITSAEALGSSTDGWGTIAPGHPGDLVVLDDDPLPATDSTRAAADALRDRHSVLTVIAGQVVHSEL